MTISFKTLTSLVVVITALTGCATLSGPPSASISANKEAGYVEKLQRVVIVSSAPQGERTFAPPSIAAQLKSKGVIVATVEVDPLELNRGQSVRDAVARINATHVFVVNQGPFHKRTMSSGYGLSSNIDATELIESEIQSTSLRKVVWRARNVLVFTRPDPEERAEAIAASMIRQLVTDAMVNP